MAITSYFFDAVQSGGSYDRVYSSGDFAKYLDKIVGSGVFPNPSDSLQVMSGTGMQVNVQPGQGFIDGHKMINDAVMSLTVQTADVTLNRIDRVIFYYDLSSRDMNIAIKTGTPASSPTAPTLTRTQNRIEHSLATVSVPAKATSITQSMITDTRPDSSVCGWVQGLIQQIDTSTLYEQWTAAYNEQFEYYSQQFEDWFKTVQDQLTDAALVSEFTRTYTTTESSLSSLTIGIPVYVHGVDVLTVYVNGMRLASDEYINNGTTITFTNPIDVIGTKIEIVVTKATGDVSTQAGGSASTDDTLSVSGMAADAKKTGDAIKDLEDRVVELENILSTLMVQKEV